MSISQVSVFLENKSGALADFTSTIAKNNINIKAMNVAENAEFGIVRLIVDDAYDTVNRLKDEGYIARLSQVVGVTICDKSGSLSNVIAVLNKAGIDVEYLYSYLGGKKQDHAHILLKVSNNEEAESILRSAGIEVLED